MFIPIYLKIRKIFSYALAGLNIVSFLTIPMAVYTHLSLSGSQRYLKCIGTPFYTSKSKFVDKICEKSCPNFPKNVGRGDLYIYKQI